MLLCTLLLTTSSFASSIITLKKEASDALYHISYCTTQISEILVEGAWIGETKKWSNRNRNYGYDFSVFNTDWSDFSTYKVGVIKLHAKYIANPPADASSYEFVCKIKK